MSEIKENDKVKVHYTGKLSDGSVFDSSEGKDPLEFVVGSGQLIKGFDQGVIGMKVNDSKTVNIPCDDAYGPINDNMIFEVPNDQLPKDVTPTIGMQMISKQPDGSEIPLIIKGIKESSIILDANHPLAGKDLIFEIKVVSIN